MKRLSAIVAMVSVLCIGAMVGGCDSKRVDRRVLVVAATHETPAERVVEAAITVATADFLRTHAPFAVDLYTEMRKVEAVVDVTETMRVSDFEQVMKSRIAWDHMTVDRQWSYRDLFHNIRVEINDAIKKARVEHELDAKRTYIATAKIARWMMNATVSYCPTVCVTPY